MIEPIRHPLSLRFASAIERWLRERGLELVPIDPDKWIRQAKRLSGLDDLGLDAQGEEGLQALAQAARASTELSLVGRMALQQQVVRALSTRLRRRALEAADPARFQAPLNRPLIVVGLPRSGTTALHRLLAQVEDAHALPFWQLRNPYAPTHGPDRRRAELLRDLKRIKRLAPELDRKHFLDADEPEECLMLFDETFVSLTFWVLMPVWGHLDWLLRQDTAEAYRVYRRHLQHFQHAVPEHRLVLKAPAHTPFLGELLDAVPEACIVQTHRDPVAVCLSVNSLFYTMHSVTSQQVDVPRMAARNLDMLAELSQRNMAARDRLPPGRVFDVQYDELCRDPLGTVQAIHDAFGLPLSQASQARLRAHTQARPKNRFGSHPTSAEELGLDPDQIRARFAGYIDQYLSAG